MYKKKIIKINEYLYIIFLFFLLFDIIVLIIGYVVIKLNRKGQALIEFVLILPVFLLILFTIVDFGMILTNKNNLENISTDIAREIKNGKSTEEISNNYGDIKINVSNFKNDYQKIIIYKNIHINTPGLDRILGNPYRVEVERIIPKNE